jgi:lipopolysaccharide assembly outer membrane protein LptD (OstA)
MRLNQFAVSLDFSVSELLKGNEQKKSQPTAGQAGTGINPADMRNNALSVSAPDEEANAGSSLYDEYGYLKFDAPWSMDVSYSLNCFKTAFKSTISQALTMRGHVQLTKNMNITYTTGYDFTAKEITMTQIMITRNLHCWNMNFSWVPNGNMKMWEFSIRVNASILQDLKYERRKDYHDNY